jgi:uncharacterized protein
MKFLVWFAVGLIVGLWLLEKKRQRRMAGRERQGASTGRQQDGVGRRQAALSEPESMLPCARCGVHIPASEALLAGDEAFCSVEHKAQQASRPQTSQPQAPR